MPRGFLRNSQRKSTGCITDSAATAFENNEEPVNNKSDNTVLIFMAASVAEFDGCGYANAGHPDFGDLTNCPALIAPCKTLLPSRGSPESPWSCGAGATPL